MFIGKQLVFMCDFTRLLSLPAADSSFVFKNISRYYDAPRSWFYIFILEKYLLSIFIRERVPMLNAAEYLLFLRIFLFL